MLKRLFWLLIGTGFGFAVSFWVTRTVKETFARYTPERVGESISTSLKGVGTDLRAAVAEGRTAMREREAALRAELDRAR